MSITKQKGDIVEFVKQKDYIMVNNNLGNGSFGKTVLLKDPYIDELFVAKKYEPQPFVDKEIFYKNFIDEIRILHKLNHHNIVRIYNYYAYENICSGYILMEFVDGKTIDEYLTGYGEDEVPSFNDSRLDNVFIQLIDAFAYMEKHNVIHRDIREGNILIDKSGIVKIIDFGIGKIEDSAKYEDSLRSWINRDNADTLPQEYYIGEYTSLTDMYYLAELFNRLMRQSKQYNEFSFSYQNIVEKMMQKKPEDRFNSFEEVRKVINKEIFRTLDISEDDKQIYHAFVDGLFGSLSQYNSERKFNTSPEIFCEKLQKALQNNIFEEYIQNNVDVIDSVVLCSYRYDPNVEISCKAVREFLEWYNLYDSEMKNLILQNIISKLSTIYVFISDEDVPF